MIPEDAKERILALFRSRGQEIASHDDTGFWAYVAAATKQRFSFDREYERIREECSEGRSGTYKVPFMYMRGTPNKFANGKWRYLTHGRGDGEQPCIDDFASEVGRAAWPDYHVERDAFGRVTREGPRPFKSQEDRMAYEKLTGLHEGGAGDFDEQPHPYEEQFREYPKLREMFPEFANWGKSGDHSFKGKRTLPEAQEVSDG